MIFLLYFVHELLMSFLMSDNRLRVVLDLLNFRAARQL